MDTAYRNVPDAGRHDISLLYAAHEKQMVALFLSSGHV